jgi:hypothetical protein
MRRWGRRLVYGLIMLVWLVVMISPAFAFVLAARGELQFGSSSGNQVRFFMIQQADADGVAVEWTRPLRQDNRCLLTTVRYWLWQGEGEPVSSCRCYSDDLDVAALDQTACERR